MLKIIRKVSKKLKTKDYGLKADNGSIVMPVLFIVTAFGILLVSGDLVNISFVDKALKYSSPDTTTDPQKQNLQLKKVSFQLKPSPTPVADDCNHDNLSCQLADPEKCDCVAYLFKCENNVCVDADPSKSVDPSMTKEEICRQANSGNWCQSFSCGKDGWVCVGKPVIYLYPEFPMLVDVSVKTAGKVVVSDPQIETTNGPVHRSFSEGGWTDVMAHPNGILFYNNQAYRELFYESETRELKQPNAGIIIKDEELEAKLLEFIKQLGLTRNDEQKEFMDWWLPRLKTQNSPYWFVSILDHEEKQRLDQVTIEPKPDTFIEFIVYFKPLEEFEQIEELNLPPTPERKGFTAIEWGGVIESKK